MRRSTTDPTDSEPVRAGGAAAGGLA